MWSLYRTLGSYDAEDSKTYLYQEINSILDHISNRQFLESLNILYPKIFINNGLQAANLFIKGLTFTGYFSFQQIIKDITRGSS